MIIDPGTSHMIPLLKRHAEKERVDVVQLPDDSKTWAFVKALRAKEKQLDHLSMHTHFRSPILAIDPGETTGIAVYDPSSKVILLAQLVTKTIIQGHDALNPIIAYLAADKPGLSHVRFEDYRVYGHMTEQHAGNNLHTAQMIGCIRTICHQQKVPCTTALAAHAKAFWTDEKLKLCGVYNKGIHHARDAERHLLRYMGEPKT